MFLLQSVCVCVCVVCMCVRAHVCACALCMRTHTYRSVSYMFELIVVCVFPYNALCVTVCVRVWMCVLYTFEFIVFCWRGRGGVVCLSVWCFVWVVWVELCRLSVCIEYHILVNMYHVSAQKVDERMINVHYYYYYYY